MRLLGLPIEPPQAVVNRVVSDLAAVARLAGSAPAQFDRLLELGEEITAIGRRVLAIAERLDERADAIMALGERLDSRAAALLELGSEMRDLGGRIDARGGEIVDGANRVVETGSELIAVLPAFERALEMATPLEGAIDRFGRLVDRLPGGSTRRREAFRDPTAAAPGDPFRARAAEPPSTRGPMSTAGPAPAPDPAPEPDPASAAAPDPATAPARDPATAPDSDPATTHDPAAAPESAASTDISRTPHPTDPATPSDGR